MNIGARIKFLHEKKGYTTNKLANMSGVSQSHLREIKLGTRNPTVETLSYFCYALDISLSDFFSDDINSINPFLISAIRKLSDEQQQSLASFICTITE